MSKFLLTPSHILHVVFYTFPLALTVRICFNNQGLPWLLIISFILVTLMDDSRSILDATRSKGTKGWESASYSVFTFSTSVGPKLQKTI